MRFDSPRDFTGPDLFAARASVPLSTILQPIKLHPLTVADDPNYLTIIAAQPILPEAIRAGLAQTLSLSRAATVLMAVATLASLRYVGQRWGNA